MIVYVEKELVDLLLYLVVGLGITVTLVSVAWFVREWRTPIESKTIRKATHKKQSMLLLAGDDALLEVEPIVQRGNEGNVETQPKGKLKSHFTGFYPRKSPLVLVDVPETQTNGGTPTINAHQTQAIAEYIATLNTKQTFLKGAKIAFGVAYKGKAIITTIASLAALKVLDDLKRLYPNDIINVDVAAVKHYVSNQWNISQIQANEADKFRAGQLDTSRTKDLKWWMLPLLTLGFVFGMAALVIVAIKFI